MHLYYPDWSPGGTGCVNDGNEPAYMSANPSWYLYSTLDDCCTTYFGWNYDGCMGNVRGTCVKALFYPDWEGTNEGCVDDGNEPPYMRDNYVYYSECCRQWVLPRLVSFRCTAAFAQALTSRARSLCSVREQRRLLRRALQLEL